MAHEQYSARCDHILNGIVHEWRLEVQPVGGAVRHEAQALQLLPVLHLPLPQSVWLRFSLPIDLVSPDGGETLLRSPLDLSLWAVCSSRKRLLLQLHQWQMPLNDIERFLDSHRTGVYAWQARSNEGAAPLPKQSRSHTQVLHMAVYIHFEQLLRNRLSRGQLWALPQEIPTARPVLAAEPGSNHIEPYLEVVVDFCTLAQGRLGGARARLHPGNRLEESTGNLVWKLSPSSSEWFQVFRPPDAHLRNHFLHRVLHNRGLLKGDICSGGGTTASALDTLEELCQSEAMVDFALYNQQGELLIGRSGVELWEQQQELLEEGGQPSGTLASWRAYFLVDDVEGRLGDNWLELKPSSSHASLRASLSITPASWQRLCARG